MHTDNDNGVVHVCGRQPVRIFDLNYGVIGRWLVAIFGGDWEVIGGDWE